MALKTISGVFLVCLLVYLPGELCAIGEAGQLPSSRDALVRIYGGQQRADSKLWFSQRFLDGGLQKYVVFGKRESSSPHSVGAVIGAAVYLWNGKSWQLETVAPDVGTIGTFGKAPKSRQATLLSIANDALGFVFEYTDGQAGYHTIGARILGYQGGKFSELGWIKLGEDNAGSCDVSPARLRLAKQGIACWSYGGKVTVADAGVGKYRDLIVVHKGCIGHPFTNNERQLRSFDKRVVYQFCDDSYCKRD